MPVVVDTSVALKWVLTEVHTAEARALRDDVLRRKEVLYAPSLLLYEATNVLYQHVRRGVLPLFSAQERIAGVVTPLNLRILTSAIARRAMEIAHAIPERYAYDTQFLALAERIQCDLWTADEDFRRAMNRNGFAQVRAIGTYPLPAP